MAKVTIRIKHVSWRDGRPRFQPGPKLRRLGFKGEDIKGPTGAWLSAEAAVAWVDAKVRAIEAHRAAKAAGQRAPRARRPNAYTVSGLFEDLWRSAKFTGGGKIPGRKVLADSTVQDYRDKAAALEAFDAELAATDITALTKPILIGLHEKLWQAKGHHMANAVIAVLRLALTHAERLGRIPSNPAMRLGLETPKARLRVGSIAEMTTLLRAADAIGETMVGHSIMLGLMTGQRLGDRLALQDAGAAVLDAGWRRFRQAKTGAVVEIPETPQLALRLAAARDERARAGTVVANVLVDPRTRQAFTYDAYARRYQLVRAAAVAGVKDEQGREIVPPCPSLAGFRDQDLRDTAVTWLARAGCTIPQVRAITGHDEASVYEILKHYLAIDREIAADAIGKLVVYLEQKGAAL